jgi:cytochrome c oxidase cbb3-type subunit 3
MADKRELDEATQTETTGHEWDGIKELDTPMPRWWLWTLYATIVWGVIFTILMPSWPLVNRAMPGLLGYSTRQSVATELAAAGEANAALDERLVSGGLSEAKNDPDLLRFAMAGGAAVFRNNCAPCHGAGAGGVVGRYPNLLDNDWLWGGTIDDIDQTIAHGIRFDADEDTRIGDMPAFDGVIEPAEIDGLVQYVLSLSGAAQDPASAEQSKQLFVDNCASCHGEDGKGMHELGSANLTDAIWLYGSDPAAIRNTILHGRHGQMPAFGTRLSPADIAKVAIYVNTLGGGE